jgi:putative ABC transport system permease protein
MQLTRSLGHGIRWMVRRPLASLTSALCLGVGLAACAVAWTLIDATVLRPFGLPNSNRLIVAWETDLVRRHDLIEVSLLNFLDWQREVRTLESIAAFGSSHWPGLARIGSDTVPITTRGVSATFFSTLGVRPALGRDVGPDDYQSTAPAPAILSHRIWQSRFGSSTTVIGQQLFIDGKNHQIIGVMPRGFGYPDDPDVWISVERVLAEALSNLPLDSQRQVGVLEVLGRRKLEASIDDVREELTAIVAKLRRLHGPPEQATVTAVVRPYSDMLLGRLGMRWWIAIGMAAIVWLFGCANVASVRVAHARERASEAAARLFLGASRTRLATDLAVEAVPLVVSGCVAATWLWSGLVAMLSRVPVVAESGVTLGDYRVSALMMIAVLGVMAWGLVGVLPAWMTWRDSTREGLLSSSRIAPRTRAVAAPLLIGQAAIAIAVIAIAGAALQAFDRLSRTDMGFAAAGVTLVDVAVPDWKYESIDARRALLEQLAHNLRELPGVRRVAAVSLRPFRFGEIADGLPVRRYGDASTQVNDATGASRVVVTPDYFVTIGQPIVEGRGFTTFDRANSEPVVVVSRALARALWAGESAVGQRLETFTLSEKWRSRLVIGVAGDARYRGLERPSMELYLPGSQASVPLGSFVIASESPSTITESLVRVAIGRVEPEMGIERIQTTDELLQSVFSPARLLATLMTLLGGAVLLLLTLGIFGAASVALRVAWSEIAVRQAVGARPFQAARAPLSVLGRALGIGIAIGLALAPLALSSVQAIGLTLEDNVALPLVAGAVAVVLAAAMATAPSLWKAARTSPAELLREN